MNSCSKDKNALDSFTNELVRVGSRSKFAVSIIINTDGRRDRLAATLESLRQLDYSDFEVCVVYGPTADGTKELLGDWVDRVKIAHCPTRNLSQSRNIGLALSAGELVAFLDDDSIPEPEWLSKITAPFVDEDVAACGGFLFDHTGLTYQWRFGTADRMGRADESWDRATPEFNFPRTANFPHVMANSAFRLSAVLAVGGFDEQYIYFLDETDLICRLVDHGNRIIQLNGAAVHHKYAASDIRTEGRLLTAWYAIIRSKIYFSLVNTYGHHDVLAAIQDAIAFIKKFEDALEWAISVGKLPPDLRDRFKEDVDKGLRSGLAEGLSANRIFYDASALAHHTGNFRPFPVLRPRGRRYTICLLTQTYPPGSIGGVGRYIHQLARSIAMLGHQVHVLTRANEHDTVDLEDGVWVHRLTPKRHRYSDRTQSMPIPDHIWNHAATMRDEVRKIALERDVDVVYAPIWDCEGIAILLSNEFKLVTSLQTTLTFWLDSHRHMRADKDFMNTFATPMLAVERYLIENSDGIHAISNAIAHEIESAYRTELSRTRTVVVPLGQEDWSTLPGKLPEPLKETAVRLLFVGRLEERKGIDVLLLALPEILAICTDLHVDIVGNDRLQSGHGKPYRQLFETTHAGSEFLRRVHFYGEVDEETLRGFYRVCDFFVAPSRFESFGLILVEAMMFGKPVIACRAGGMVEVVEEGVSGLLAEPGDQVSLRNAIVALAKSAALRTRMGRAGRERYEVHFTPKRMAEGVLSFLANVADRQSQPKENKRLRSKD